MSNPFVGEIRIVGFNFAPRGWATCSGQLLPISQNTALFSLLGTTYGGNGQSTFALPNFIDRAPMHAGQGPGLTDRQLGESSGSPTVTLTTVQLPVHGHTVQCVSAAPSSPQQSPVGNIWAPSAGRTGAALYQNGAANAGMNANAVGNSGGGQPHNNMQPYLGVMFIIAMQGIFPPRN